MLFKALRAYRQESPLSWRLLVFILGFSAFAALFSSGVQLAFNYRQEVSQVDLRIQQFNYVNQAGLAAAVWNFDRYQISSRLNGLVNLPDIKYAEVADPQGKPMIVAGVKPSVLPGKVHRLDLTYMDSTGLTTQVGQLIVIPSLTGVYERVLDYGLLIVAAQSAKTFFVSIFILYIVTQWISRPLTLLSRQIRERHIGNLDQPWHLSRPRWAGENDELNVLVSALNNMQETLRGEVAAIRHIQSALQQSEERNRALLETTHAVPWIADCQTAVFSYIGPQCAEILGIETTAWLQADFLLQRTHPDDYALLMTVWQAEETTALQHELRLRRDDGGEQWVALHGGRFAQDGVFRGYLLNIEKQKSAELALHNYQEKLEQQVRERTVQLQLRNTELTELNNRLASTQSQLLQSEKMASIGQLAAGVAHEINNPIGFVSSNVNTLSSYVLDILELLGRYEASQAQLTEQQREDIARFKQNIDFEFLRQDIDDLLVQSREGLMRVKKIVQDLREFSRLDNQDGWQLVDIHQCIDSTLSIAHNEIKYKATVSKDYGDLPEIYCQPGQINQVLLNLLVNAAQAMQVSGHIGIRTGVEGEQVWLEISDDGDGIPAEVLPRIFEPFFTTKPVGKGTGLGLSISYGIIQRHRGQIICRSEPGHGTTFRIVLPIQPEPIEGA
ncbi:ATP-binding protein [Chitinimonas viridis]|uniref:histidine kinase n=1 Tax=Chitinimonas viridis TaxID=664880 RepID=A0ABT8B486_9NEIS|nr:ATP-binding protein [Chitinimonas viridis]MDN3576530.1 ATP-binding protein [Chitinimonas viridis]